MDPTTIVNNTSQGIRDVAARRAAIVDPIVNLLTNKTKIADDIRTAVLARNGNLAGVINPAAQANADALTSRDVLIGDNIGRFNNPANLLRAVAIQRAPRIAAAQSLSNIRDLVAGNIADQTRVAQGTIQDRIDAGKLGLDENGQQRQDVMDIGNLNASLESMLFGRDFQNKQFQNTLDQQKFGNDLTLKDFLLRQEAQKFNQDLANKQYNLSATSARNAASSVPDWNSILKQLTDLGKTPTPTPITKQEALQDFKPVTDFFGNIFSGKPVNIAPGPAAKSTPSPTGILIPTPTPTRR